MERDEDSPRNGYTSTSYTDVLAQVLPQFMRATEMYMQDNAPIHTSAWTTEWLHWRQIPLLTPSWPPWSPDLNPIEHAWHKLRDMLLIVDPTIGDATGSVVEILHRLKASLQAAWAAIPQSFFNALVDTWFHRIEAVRLVNGWYTKY